VQKTFRRRLNSTKAPGCFRALLFCEIANRFSYLFVSHRVRIKKEYRCKLVLCFESMFEIYFTSNTIKNFCKDDPQPIRVLFVMCCRATHIEIANELSAKLLAVVRKFFDLLLFKELSWKLNVS